MVLSVGWVGSIRWKSGMSNPLVAWILMSQVVDYSITNKIAILSATDADSNMYHPPLFGTIWVYWIYSCLGWWLFANDSLLGSFVALGLRSSSLSSSSSSSSSLSSSSSSSSSYHVGLAMAQYLLVNSQRTHVSYYGFMHCTYPEKLYVFKLLNHVYICINMYVCFYIYIYIYICMYVYIYIFIIHIYIYIMGSGLKHKNKLLFPDKLLFRESVRDGSLFRVQ